MTTQPSDWAVARAFHLLIDPPENAPIVENDFILQFILTNARELDAGWDAPEVVAYIEETERGRGLVWADHPANTPGSTFTPLYATSRAAEAYAKANPLGGPATMFETIARRLRAGENYDEVLADYGLARAAEVGDGSSFLFTPSEVEQAMEVLRGRHGSTALIAEALDEMERCLRANADDEDR